MLNEQKQLFKKISEFCKELGINSPFGELG